MKIIPALIPKPRLLPPLRTSGGIFDFAIYYSATVISVTKNGHTFVNGKLNRTPSDDPQSKGTEKTSIVLHFSKLGAESFAESRENARLLVDLLDVCGDEWQVESCHICIPKHSKHCVPLAKFLVDFCGFNFDCCGTHDAYEWMCVSGDL